MFFELIKTSTKSNARAGILHTAHGDIETPVFMPVATQATLKYLTIDQLHDIHTSILLCNTYHLALRPGLEVIEACGGLHRFMNWQKPILTDSGGYQVFSLESNRKISEEGVTFQSHLDGSTHVFTPEKVVELQRGFGVDIMMPLDICSAYPSDEATIDKELDHTYRWEQRARDAWRSNPRDQQLFGIVQGGMYKDRDLCKPCRDKSETLGCAVAGGAVGVTYGSFGLCLPISCLATLHPNPSSLNSNPSSLTPKCYPYS